MAFEILTAEGKDAERWHALVSKLPPQRQDIHFLPEYGRIFQEAYGYSSHLAVFRSGGDVVIQPFVRRPLMNLPFLRDAADREHFTDIANPYGYGGPVSNIGGAAAGGDIYREFAREFSAWCDEADIASEFASLHPFMSDHQRALAGTVVMPLLQKQVVYVDLTQTQAAIAKGLRKGHRSSIAAARRAGAVVQRAAPTIDNLTRFNALYHATMVRRQAAERWFVPANFFENCLHQLGPDRSSLFFASVDGEIESGCLLVHDFSTAYYHFASTRAGHPALGINNLMIHEVIHWAQAAGFARLHLGGGVTGRADDSLLRFKAGFSACRAPLYTYFSVRDQAIYDRLSERKRAYEITTLGRESRSGFLPLYRREDA
ncbi:MAG: GNAT family N-acetyltransferase [Pseudorhodoplanes sp.]|uniref:GNAT family N-acetyltransferase n=1 Tax=Pseudorhodoplanes sp. TaxID=1934341 RepID=UPI003D12E2C0